MENYINTECTETNKTHYPIGKIIGVNNGVIAYAKCRNCFQEGQLMDVVISKDDHKELNLYQDEYIGYRWQCVEYARKWLIYNKGVSFKSIWHAYMIFDIDEVRDVTKEDCNYKFQSYKNENVFPPESGDLAIYPVDKGTPWGHVAVMTNVNLDKGYIELSEQNFDRHPWKDVNSYSRRVLLLKNKDGLYTLTEIEVYDKNNSIEFDYETEKKKVIGWKRVFK
jgi:hypothetical protein